MNPRDTNAWFVPSRARSHPRARLFCFPYAGGGASLFRSWADLLPEDIEVCPVQLPGRENRFGEPCFSQLAPLIEAMGTALWPTFDMPFAFFGHSMGALIGFELARWLRRRGGLMPLHLFVSAHRAPQLPYPHAHVHHLPDAEFMNVVRHLKGVPDTVREHADLLELMVPQLRADFSIVETYQYVAEDPLASPITAFGGLADAGVSQDDLAAWREQTQSTFTLRMLPGDHFFMSREQVPLLRAIARDLMRFDR
ncbi:MAG TPA: thioesterase domain-containing protein [Ktedonobacterales bacterium]|nr:thioesterase domain-containing protein [Ktedonobacterales bacterium]